ncbi:hypothetical protein ACHAWF_015846 [Thalassiosira exigua]
MAMDSMAQNKSIEAFCRDSSTYRNPVNGNACSDHYGTNCTDRWLDVLGTDQLSELLESCPESCNLVSECMNARSSGTSTNSIAVAAMWTIGLASLLSFGFWISQRWTDTMDEDSLDPAPDGSGTILDEEDHSAEASSVTVDDTTLTLDDLAFPFPPPPENTTPRWLPELNNISVDTDSPDNSVNEQALTHIFSPPPPIGLHPLEGNAGSGCELKDGMNDRTSTQKFSFGGIANLPPSSGLHPVMGEKEIECELKDGMRSPTDSVTVSVVHLLGLETVLSREEDSVFSSTILSPTTFDTERS